MGGDHNGEDTIIVNELFKENSKISVTNDEIKYIVKILDIIFYGKKNWNFNGTAENAIHFDTSAPPSFPLDCLFLTNHQAIIRYYNPSNLFCVEPSADCHDNLTR